MADSPKCPECGAPLPANSPEGLCRACLLRRGLEMNTVGYTQEPRTPWTPPTVDELAARFPELEIQRLIGRGGMGAVYQARQKSLDRMVALKILPPAMASEAAFAERFAREAQAMAKLNHPHIVTIYEFGHLGARASSPASSPDSPDLYFFLMEYVDGLNLRGLLDSGHISPKEALAIVPQICEALQYAHDQGIVHRDIKPENILLNKQGRVKIADFGLAKLMGVAGESRTQKTESRNGVAEVTVAGSVMGTPQYMAPEQKEHPTEVDHRADIYSLGVVFYQMLTGELPKGAFEPPSRKVHIDVRLDEIVLRALEKEPERRYQHASEVKTQVETVAASPGDSLSVSYARNVSTREHSRLSRTAVVGVAWITLFFAVVPAFLAHEGATHEFQSRGPFASPLGALVCFGIILPAFLAPFGATILGWIAIDQIRRSGGRIYGLGLAVFDAVLFLLIALDAVLYLAYLVGLLAALTVFRSVGFTDSHQPWWNLSLLLWAAFCFLALVLVDVLVVRRIWRAVNKPLAGPNPPHETIPPLEAPPASAPEGVTVSAWCQVVSLLLGTTFTSRLAIRLTNLSALGFLGFLAFLAFVPIPGMHRCLGFSGFFGFFGLIGFALMIEMAAQRKARRASGQYARTGPPFGPGRQLLLVIGGALLALVAGYVVWRIAFYTPPSPPVSGWIQRRERARIVAPEAIPGFSPLPEGTLEAGVEPPTTQPESQAKARTAQPEATKQSVASTEPAAEMRLKIAEETLARIRILYDSAAASYSELLQAQLERDLADADLKGDRPAALRAKLDFGEKRLSRVRSSFEAGAASYHELFDAQLERDMAAVELTGNTPDIAKVKMEGLAKLLQYQETQFKAGLCPRLEVDMLRLQFERAKAEYEAAKRGPTSEPSSVL